MAFLILALFIAAIGFAATNWGALSIPLVAIVLTMISRMRRGADGIDEFYTILFGTIVLSAVIVGGVSISKSLIGFGRNLL